MKQPALLNIRTRKEAVLKNLQVIPGVGKSISLDLYDLGIRAVKDLVGRDPEVLYERSNALAEMIQDPCLHMFSDAPFICRN
jgi:predicted RecB family nuclease